MQVQVRVPEQPSVQQQRVLPERVLPERVLRPQVQPERGLQPQVPLERGPGQRPQVRVLEQPSVQVQVQVQVQVLEPELEPAQPQWRHHSPWLRLRASRNCHASTVRRCRSSSRHRHCHCASCRWIERQLRLRVLR